MLTHTHLALIRAALTFFDEENSPHGPQFIAMYLNEPLDEQPTGSDVAELRKILQDCQLRYVCCDESATRLVDDGLHSSIESAERRLSDPHERVVTAWCCQPSP